MSEIKDRLQPDTVAAGREAVWPPDPAVEAAQRRQPRVLAVVVTISTVMFAGVLCWAMWQSYMATPWTRDATVRAYVVTMAPEVSGRIISLPVAGNQFVHEHDALMVIDPTNYAISVRVAEAAVRQASANWQNAAREAKRREALPDFAVSAEQQQSYQTQAAAAQAQYQQAAANLDQARVNLERTVIHSPVNGWVTNLLAQRGDFASAGQNLIAVVDADSFWIDGYFEETNLAQIHVGDAAAIKLMGYHGILGGHVDSITRAINVANAQPNGQGVATVNPIFTWVRLAQRIPVRIRLDDVPPATTLAAGMTATVEINTTARAPVPK
jgi:RND family efflux transporter MFP subunit